VVTGLAKVEVGVQIARPILTCYRVTLAVAIVIAKPEPRRVLWTGGDTVRRLTKMTVDQLRHASSAASVMDSDIQCKAGVSLTGKGNGRDEY